MTRKEYKNRHRLGGEPGIRHGEYRLIKSTKLGFTTGWGQVIHGDIALKEYKTRHDSVEKVINGEIARKEYKTRHDSVEKLLINGGQQSEIQRKLKDRQELGHCSES